MMNYLYCTAESEMKSKCSSSQETPSASWEQMAHPSCYGALPNMPSFVWLSLNLVWVHQLPLPMVAMPHVNKTLPTLLYNHNGHTKSCHLAQLQPMVSAALRSFLGSDSPAAVILLSKFPVLVIPLCQNTLAMTTLFSWPSLPVTTDMTKTSPTQPEKKVL